MKQEDYAELKRLCRLDGKLRMGRQATCAGKHAFGSFEEATRYTRNRRQYHTYRCRFCSKWHRGSSMIPQHKSYK